jgi:hypothetical protein
VVSPDVDPPSEEEVGYRKPPKRTQFKPGNVPQNKKASRADDGLEGVLQHVLSEPTQVKQDGKVLRMSIAERAIRLDVERAVRGDTRAIKAILKLVLRNPKLATPAREYILFINGVDALA